MTGRVYSFQEGGRPCSSTRSSSATSSRPSAPPSRPARSGCSARPSARKTRSTSTRPPPRRPATARSRCRRPSCRPSPTTIPSKGGLLRLLNVDIGLILHGEQHYDYLAPVFVGDKITCQQKVIDIYDKKGGALWFVVSETSMKDQTGKLGRQGHGHHRRAQSRRRARSEGGRRWQPLPSSPRSRWATRSSRSSCRRSPATSSRSIAAARATTIRSMSISTSPRSSASRTCSPTACCRWASSAAWSPATRRAIASAGSARASPRSPGWATSSP